MSALPMATPVRVGDSTVGQPQQQAGLISPSRVGSSGVGPSAAGAGAAVPNSCDLSAFFSSEGAESVAAAALRDFCSAPAAAAAAAATAATSEGTRAAPTLGESSTRRSKEGQPRHSSRSSRKKETRNASPARRSRQLSPPPASASTHSDSRSPTPTSSSSAVDSDADSSRSSSVSYSPPPRRHKQARGEGERNSPAAPAVPDSALLAPAAVSASSNSRAARSGTDAYPVSGGRDYSSYSSDSHAHVDVRRVDESRVPPRKPPQPRTNRYNTFGETDRSAASVAAHARAAHGPAAQSALEQARTMLSQAHDLKGWLAAQGFDASIHPRLVASGATTLSQASLCTKSYLKSLLGVGNGIRLWMALKEVEAARSLLIASGVTDESITEGRGKSGRPKLTAASCRPGHHMGSTRSDSPGTLFRELHPPGLHGYCALSDCDLPANVACSSRQCQVGLCTYHAHKLILTGATLCEHCYAQSSLLDNVRDVTGITALQEQGYIANTDQCVLQ